MYDARSVETIGRQVDLIAAAADRPGSADTARLVGHLYLLAEDLVGRDHTPDLVMKARIHDLIGTLTASPTPKVSDRRHAPTVADRDHEG